MTVSRKYLARALKLQRSIGTSEGMPQLTPRDEAVEDQRYRREVLRLVYKTMREMGMCNIAEHYVVNDTRHAAIREAIRWMIKETYPDYLIENFRAHASIPGNVEWD